VSSDFRQFWSALGERLATLAQQDPAVRAELRQLAIKLLELTSPVQTPAPAPIELAPPSPVVAPPPPAPPPMPVRTVPAEPLPPLTLGQPRPFNPLERPSTPTWNRRATDVGEADLPMFAARCRLKAEGCRWAANRRRRLAEGVDYRTEIEPKDSDIIARARNLPDCFLWMCHPDGPEPANLALFDLAGGNFEALADVLTLMHEVRNSAEASALEFEQALDLLAEAQSAVRAAVFRLEERRIDTDQQYVFNWLKATAAAEQIFIRRFMRVDDPAEPARWPELIARIEALDHRLQDASKRGKQRRKLLGKLRHKTSIFPSSAPSERLALAQALAQVVDELITSGMAPSNAELREMLLPMVDDLPDIPTTPPGFERVLREIDRFLAAAPPPSENDQVRDPPPAVRNAARLLDGRSIVLIGGDRRPQSEQALKQALGLSDLLWVEAREHTSITRFEPYIARPDVALVLLAIRWSSHSYSEVSEFCQRYGKPLVRLPGGYNPNQVATQILDQCSARLEK
jgi:hypothetical protein